MEHCWYHWLVRQQSVYRPDYCGEYQNVELAMRPNVSANKKRAPTCFKNSPKA